MIRKLSALFLIAAAVLALAAGCSKPAATTSKPPSMPALSGISLADTSWVLVSYGDPAALKTVISGTHPTLVFNADTTQVSGTGGVNGFGGDCQRTDNQITFTQIIQTEMASLDPAIMAQENAYFDLLLKAQSVAFETGTMTIDCDGGQVLNFTAAASAAPMIPVIGTPTGSQSSLPTGSVPSVTVYPTTLPNPPAVSGGTQTSVNTASVTLTVTAVPPVSR
jgi:heat shock protein HslJ